MLSLVINLRRIPRHSVLFIETAVAACFLTACGSLPTAGPGESDIIDQYQAKAATHPFELVDVSANTVTALKNRTTPSLATHFGIDPTAPEITIGRGDGVSVSIWEAGSEPLFFASAPVGAQSQTTAANAARMTTLPEQFVGSDGGISVPFAGRIAIAGLTLWQAQDGIQHALAGKAQNPQVLVNLTHNASDAVTVIGEVSAGARVPLSARGDRLLDVLASAGGIRVPTYETWLQLTRADNSITVPLLQVLNDPQENVYLHPGDNLVVTRQAESFTAFGATGRNAQINFEAVQINLSEAMAKAGGLTDARADPQGVFLFRYEPRGLAASIGTPPDSPSGNPSDSGTTEDALVPVVYRIDLTQATGYFLAQSFQVRNHDILYIANAPATEWEKFLTLISLITQPVISGAVVQSAIH